MKISAEMINAFSNAGRNLGGMIFNAVLFWMLGRADDKTILFQYAWFLVIANLMSTFIGWGLKDYSMKEYVKGVSELKAKYSLFLSARLPLMLVCLLVIPFLNFDYIFKISLALYIVLRGIGSLNDAPAILLKKTGKLFFTDVCVYTAALLILLNAPLSFVLIVFLIILIELLKLITGLVINGHGIILNFKFKKSFELLSKTGPYFLVAIFSYGLARADVFILGFVSGGVSFSDYNILLNLISVSQVVISAIYNTSLKSIYRMEFDKAGQVLNKLGIQFVLLSLSATAVVFVILNFVYGIYLSAGMYPLIALNILFYCFTIKNLFLLTHANLPKYFLGATVFAFTINAICALLLIPHFSISGAMIANTAGAAVPGFILFFVVRRYKKK